MRLFSQPITRIVAATASTALVVSAFASCAKHAVREVYPADAHHLIDDGVNTIKAHMDNGDVYVLSDWRVHDGLLLGEGEHYDAYRRVAGEGAFTVNLSEVVLFEADRLETSPAVAGLVVMTVISIGVTVACLSNPKACFGSCPTFYVADGERSQLMAEGFSASISPSLEASDIDALTGAVADDGVLEITMKNEAYETHVVRHADVLAVPVADEELVFATQAGEFWRATDARRVTTAIAAEGDCSQLLRDRDGEERLSLSDPDYLGSKETIDLRFDDVPPGEVGLVIACRQSLMSTYLFYQTLAYMGEDAGRYIAMLERSGDPMAILEQGTGPLVANIDIHLRDGFGGWREVASIDETGPLATDTKVAPLGVADGDGLDVRIAMTQGMWRIDQVSLVSLSERVEPVRVQPQAVLQDGTANDEARGCLIDPDRQLVSLPGDEFVLIYELPDARCAVFLESRGYYLEWLREEWLVEADEAKLHMMLFEPERALRELAGDYKKYEADMEEIFWSSRYVPR